MEILQTRAGVHTYLAPSGPLHETADLASLTQAAETCAREREVNLVLDLDRVVTLNSEALETLLAIQDRLAAKGGGLKLVNVNPLLADIFRVTRVDQAVDVVSPACGRPA